MAKDILDQIRETASEIASYSGMELVHLEMHRESNGLVLRLYIDKDGGVTLEDCARVSRQLSAKLDVDDPVAERYTLEVSSPGLDRPLHSAQDFQRFAGRNVRLSTMTPLAGRRNFTGRLLGIEGESIRLALEDGQEIEIPREQIGKARLEAELNGFQPPSDTRGRHA